MIGRDVLTQNKQQNIAMIHKIIIDIKKIMIYFVLYHAIYIISNCCFTLYSMFGLFFSINKLPINYFVIINLHVCTIK